jgi:voltage-gated potassium channel
MDKLNESNNFLYLTGALLVILISLPLLKLFEEGPIHWIVRALMAGTLVVTYRSLDFGRLWRGFVALVLMLLITSTLLREFSLIPGTSLFHLGLMLTYFGSVAYFASRRVLLSGKVDGNTILGGISIYLLLGLIWSMLYLIALEFQPLALNGIGYKSWEDNLFEVTYFSFVTLATLGYGEISPAVPITQGLAYLEAVTGTFYMAVVVASLIGAQTHTPRS